PDRDTSSLSTVASRSAGCTVERPPLRRPMGERTASTITTSVMRINLGGAVRRCQAEADPGSTAPAGTDRLKREQQDDGAEAGHEYRAEVERVERLGLLPHGQAVQRPADEGADDADDDRGEAAALVGARDPPGQPTGHEPHDDPPENAHR